MNLFNENYHEEAHEKWGATQEFQEADARMKNKTSEQKQLIAADLIEILTRFGELKDQPSNAPEVERHVKILQDYISKSFYECSDDILKGLGELYVSDSRFLNNIDSFGGKGTAEFVKKAIDTYCDKD